MCCTGWANWWTRMCMQHMHMNCCTPSPRTVPWNWRKRQQLSMSHSWQSMLYTIRLIILHIWHPLILSATFVDWLSVVVVYIFPLNGWYSSQPRHNWPRLPKAGNVQYQTRDKLPGMQNVPRKHEEIFPDHKLFQFIHQDSQTIWKQLLDTLWATHVNGRSIICR